MKEAPRLSRSKIYLLVFLTTVTIRLLTVVEYGLVDPAFQYPIVDELTNVDQARGFLAEGPGHGAPYWKPPGYPLLLSVIALPWQEIGLKGQAVPISYAWIVKVIQSLLDGVTSILIAAIAGRCCGRRAALLAGLLYAIAWMPIYFCSQFLDTTLFTFLILLSVSLAISAASESRVIPWALVGLAIGVAAITRATALPVAIALAGSAWLTTGSYLQRSSRSLAVLLGCAFSVLPIFAVNMKIGGEPVLISSNGGINFYIGNRTGDGIGADGLTSVAAGPRWDDLLKITSDIDSESQRSRHYYRITWEEISDSPSLWLKKMTRKAAALLSARDVPNNKNLIEEKNRSLSMRILAWLPGASGILIALTLAGLLLGRKGLRQSDLPVILTLATLALVAWAFFVAGRYRVPILALGCIVASRGLITRGVTFKSILLYSSILLGVYLIPVPERQMMEQYCIDPVAIGYMYEQKQEPDQAAKWYRQSLEQDPDDVRALHNLGHLAQEAHQIDDALNYFQKATEVDPDHSPSWNSLGALLVPIDQERALRSFRQAVKRDPQYAGAWVNLGQLLERQGELPKALDAFQMARRLNPKKYLATILEARIQLKMHSPRNAARLLQRVPRSGLEPGISELLEEVEQEWKKTQEESPTPPESEEPDSPDPDSSRPEENGVVG